MNGQSINRSSMKYNIPARTLRDWMKRLNIKSVFTHHSQKDGRSLSSDSGSELTLEQRISNLPMVADLEEEFRAREREMAEKMESNTESDNQVSKIRRKSGLGLEKIEF